MLRQSPYTDRLTFFQKLRSFDYWLVFCIISLGAISILSMYSSEGGNFSYYTKSHTLRFGAFFLLMIGFSFIRTKFWHSTGYLFYFIVLLLLIYASLYGVTASGSQRWISLYFINLQPSELMKIAIILCLAKFFHRIRITNTNAFASILISLTIIIIPTILVITQPDLGTSILISLSGLIILWLSGLRIKYFVYSFLIFVTSLPFVISFLKPLLGEFIS